MKRASHSAVTRLLRTCLILLFVFVLAYLFVFSLFTIQIPGTDVTIVKGFACTEIAQAQFAQCPWLVTEQMAQAEWDPALLWTALSITTTKVGIVLLWLALFFNLSLFLGAFLVRLRR